MVGADYGNLISEAFWELLVLCRVTCNEFSDYGCCWLAAAATAIYPTGNFELLMLVAIVIGYLFL